MQVSAPNEGTTAQHTKSRVSPDTRLGTIHAGARYVLGFGPDSYSIWDEYSKDAPAERFPATDAGRQAAWKRFLELEPGARDALDAEVAASRPHDEQTRRRRRWPILVAILVVVVGAIVGIVVAQSGGNGGTGGTTVDVGKEAHLDVSGGQTVNEDLTLSSFKASSTQAVFGGVVDATWKGPTAELHIAMSSPSTGSGNTTEVGASRVIELTLTPAPGTTIEISSSHGECSYNVTHLSDTAFAGEFTCTGIKPPNSTTPLDVKGTFAAAT